MFLRYLRLLIRTAFQRVTSHWSWRVAAASLGFLGVPGIAVIGAFLGASSPLLAALLVVAAVGAIFVFGGYLVWAGAERDRAAAGTQSATDISELQQRIRDLEAAGPPQGHVDDLHRYAAYAEAALHDGTVCRPKGMEAVGVSFRIHFTDIGHEIDGWNADIDAINSAWRQIMQVRLQAETEPFASALTGIDAQAQVDIAGLRGLLSSIAMGDVRPDALRFEWLEDNTLRVGAPGTGLGPWVPGRSTNHAAFEDALREPFGHAADWPESHAYQDAWARRIATQAGDLQFRLQDVQGWHDLRREPGCIQCQRH